MMEVSCAWKLLLFIVQRGFCLVIFCDILVIIVGELFNFDLPCSFTSASTTQMGLLEYLH